MLNIQYRVRYIAFFLNILRLFWYKLKHVKLTFICSAVLCKEKHIKPQRMSAAFSFPFTTVRMSFHPFEGGTCWQLSMTVTSQDTALMWAVRRLPYWTKETHWWIHVLQRFTHPISKPYAHTHTLYTSPWSLLSLSHPFHTHTVVWVAPSQLRMRFTQIKGSVSDLSAEAPDKSKQDESTDIFTSSPCFFLSDGCSFAKNCHETRLIRQSQATDCRWPNRFVFCILFILNTLCVADSRHRSPSTGISFLPHLEKVYCSHAIIVIHFWDFIIDFFIYMYIRCGCHKALHVAWQFCWLWFAHTLWFTFSFSLSSSSSFSSLSTSS